MFLSAYVRERNAKHYHIIERDCYTSKAKFAAELRSNGYLVIRISNKRDIAAQKHNYISFAEMKNARKFMYREPSLWRDEISEIEEIKKIPL